MADVSIPVRSGEMPAYLASPAEAGPWPGVVVVHDAFGMTHDLRRQAEWLAGAGFLSLAPDLYHGGGGVRCMFKALRQASARQGPVFDDLEASRAWLSGRDDCTGRIGVIGFCMGGGFALLLSALGGYAASSVNYGMVPKDAATLLAQACPVVGSYGGRDPSLRPVPARLEDALVRNGIPHDVKVYPDAGHGFLNHHDQSELPRWALLMLKVSRAGSHEPSAADARERIIEFFGAHLRQPAEGSDPAT